MEEGGQILAKTLREICKKAVPGISTLELDEFAEKLIIQNNATPAFKNYQGFPGTLCTCRNEVIVHGIPSKNDILQEGDLFTVDCGVKYKGMCTDAARSIGIGKISSEKEKLIAIAKKTLNKAIKIAKPGTPINQISKKIEETIKKSGFFIIKDLTGHGIGKSVHEDPIILNYYIKGKSPILEPGMTLAIEPIFSTGTEKLKTLPDNWTLITADGSPSVQQENTILITQNGNKILTE